MTAGLTAAVACLTSALTLVMAVPAEAGELAPRWTWPLAGPHAVSNAFDPPTSRYGVGHRGADLPGPVGAPVLAAGNGRVSYAGLLAGRGVVVVVHGDLRTTYEPVTALVPVGTRVAAGDPIGLLEPGHEGCPVLACLHWGLRRGNDYYLDPVARVERGPLRLLPLGPRAPTPGPLRDPRETEQRAVPRAPSVDRAGAGVDPAGPEAPGGSAPGVSATGTAEKPRTDAEQALDPDSTNAMSTAEVASAEVGAAGPATASGVPGGDDSARAEQAPGRGRDGLVLPVGLVAATAVAAGFGLARRPNPSLGAPLDGE